MASVKTVHFIMERPHASLPGPDTYVCQVTNCEEIVFDYELDAHADTHDAQIVTVDEYSWKGDVTLEYDDTEAAHGSLAAKVEDGVKKETDAG